METTFEHRFQIGQPVIWTENKLEYIIETINREENGDDENIIYYTMRNLLNETIRFVSESELTPVATNSPTNDDILNSYQEEDEVFDQQLVWSRVKPYCEIIFEDNYYRVYTEKDFYKTKSLDSAMRFAFGDGDKKFILLF